MSIFAGILFVLSIVELIKIHKDKGVMPKKRFMKGMCIFILVMSVIVGGLSSIPSNKTTATNAKPVTQVTKPKVAVAKVDTAKMNSNILYFSQIKAKDTFKDKLVKVEEDTKGILITFKLSDNLSMKLVGDGGFLDASKMFALYKGYVGDYTDVTVLGTYPMKDKYGNISDSVIFAITLDKGTINKTTFENLDPTADLVPLSSSHAIRPELITK